MKASFVTGTDTGVGKTVVCGLLGRYLISKGYNTTTQKWIQSGSQGFPEDIATHLKFMGKRKKEVEGLLSHLCPYNFKMASSAHLASEQERVTIRTDKIKKSFHLLADRFDFIIIEGMGGALVPFNRKRLVIDIAEELSLPVIIVADNRLGAINHTLLTIEAIKKRGIAIIGIIFNARTKMMDRSIYKDNPRIVSAIGKEAILGILPHRDRRELLHEAFTPIGAKILSYFKEKGR